MRTLITNGTDRHGRRLDQRRRPGRRRDDRRRSARDLARPGVTADETIDATRQVRHPGRRSTSTPTWSCRSAARSPRTPSRPGRARRPSAARRRSSTSPSSRSGRSLREGLDAWHAKAEGNAVVDYGFHMIMTDVNDATLAEMDQLVAEGVPDFKLFTAYPGVFYSDDGAIFRAMQRTAQERRPDHDARRERPGDRRRRGRPGRRRARPTRIGHGLARYPIFEGEATNRVIRLAEAAGVPVYIVHLSARDALDAVRAGPRPRRRRRSPRPARSTCSCRSTTWATASRAPSSSARRRCGPTDHQAELWTGLVKDDLAAGLDRPLPVRLPRPEGARPGRLPQDPQRPAGRRGPGRPAARRRRRRRPDHAASAGSRSSPRRRPRCSGCTRARARSRSGSDADIVVYDPAAGTRSQRGDPPHGRRLLVLRGPDGPGRLGRRHVARLGRRPRRRVHGPQRCRPVHQALPGRVRPAVVRVRRHGPRDRGRRASEPARARPRSQGPPKLRRSSDRDRVARQLGVDRAGISGVARRTHASLRRRTRPGRVRPAVAHRA